MTAVTDSLVQDLRDTSDSIIRGSAGPGEVNRVIGLTGKIVCQIIEDGVMSRRDAEKIADVAAEAAVMLHADTCAAGKLNLRDAKRLSVVRAYVEALKPALWPAVALAAVLSFGQHGAELIAAVGNFVGRGG